MPTYDERFEDFEEIERCLHRAQKLLRHYQRLPGCERAMDLVSEARAETDMLRAMQGLPSLDACVGINLITEG